MARYWYFEARYEYFLWLDIDILWLDINILWPDIDILRPDMNIIRPDIDILRPDINILWLFYGELLNGNQLLHQYLSWSPDSYFPIFVKSYCCLTSIYTLAIRGWLCFKALGYQKHFCRKIANVVMASVSFISLLKFPTNLTWLKCQYQVMSTSGNHVNIYSE